jgi:signal transduction histidine kinase
MSLYQKVLVMSLRLKLLFSFIALSVLMVIIGVVGILNAQSTSEVVTIVLERTSPELFLLGQIEATANELRETAVHHNLVHLIGLESVEAEEFEAARTELTDLIAQYEAITEDREEYEEIAGYAEEMIQATAVLLRLGNTFVPGNVIADRLEGVELAEESFKEALHEAQDDETEQFQAELAAVVSADARAQAFYVISMVGTAILALVLSFFLTRLITKPVSNLKAVATRMMQGDYTQRAEANSQDEIGQLATAFNAMATTVENRDTDLRELNANLEKRVANRTAALTKANALAQESVRLKSEFMSTMSHELRTPLNAILGFSGIMLQGMGGEMDDDALHMVERIDLNSQRLLKLINDILDLAKIEAGRMELTNVPFQPRDLVKRWEAENGVLADKKALAFEVSVAANVPDVLYGDSERITQMAVNLLSNAFKFTESGEVRLYVFQEGDSWKIRVSDTGVGIPPHALNYIFDEFRQVDGSSKRVYGGTGLGLSIVRNMCRMMQGTITVTSELGKGSVFTISLPLHTQPETQALETA